MVEDWFGRGGVNKLVGDPGGGALPGKFFFKVSEMAFSEFWGQDLTCKNLNLNSYNDYQAAQ